MSAYAHVRGHRIIYENGKWIYADTKESIKINRACTKCGQMPTSEGHDACLGHIEGIVSACCGHGIEEAIIIRGG